MNQQKPLPQRAWTGDYLVHSMFHTIQGEGPFSGEAAVFVRLEGCNLQCDFCDTDYTGGPRAMKFTAAEIVVTIKKMTSGYATRLVVITGGEPFRQDIAPLVRLLNAYDYRAQIETNGTMAPSDEYKMHCGTAAAIVVSPKAHIVDPWLAENAIAYKYVLSHDSIDPDDGLPIMVLGRKSKRVARPPKKLYGTGRIYVSPADMGDDTIATQLNHEVIVNSAKKFGYKLQLQIHKHLGVE